jgi:hypothetical protein
MLEFPPNDIRNLVATVANTQTSRMTDANDGNSVFVIPTGKNFLLKDVVLAPQYFPLKGSYSLQISSSQGISLVYPEFSSLQTSFTTGMVLKSGSTIDVAFFHDAFPGGEGSATVRIFGYLFDS